MGNQSGQLLVEMVLLVVVGIGVVTLLINGLKKMEFVENFTSKPWALMSGMVECGVWKPCGISTPAPGLHPSNRPVSYNPQGN